MRALVLAVVLGSSWVLATRPAAAECAGPGPATFPADGPLPAHPTIYRFEPTYGPSPVLRIDGPDGPVRFAVRDVSTDTDVRVRAIRIDAVRGPITVRGDERSGRYRDPDVHTYSIGAAPAPAGPLVATASRESSRWTCSFTDGIEIHVSTPGAAAIRVRWSDGAEVLVAPDARAFHGGGGGPFLGHSSCVGHQIPRERIGRRDIALAAVYPDGTARAIVLPHDLLDPRQVKVAEPAREHDRAVEALADDEPRPAAPPGLSRGWTIVLVGLGQAALLLLVIVVRSIRRRRRGAPTYVV